MLRCTTVGRNSRARSVGASSRTARISILVRCLPILFLVHHSDAWGQGPGGHDVEAIVTLTVDLPNGHSRVGSGAFVGPNGEILTCYHVVHGARKITVFSAPGKTSPDVLVEAVAPERDLAILRLRKVPDQLKWLPVVAQKPPHLGGMTFSIYGWIQGLDQQAMKATATSDHPEPAEKLILPGAAKTASSLTIIPLQLAVTHGISGGPVVFSGKVIGVMAGTDPGQGQLSWAIPVSQSDLQTMETIHRQPDLVSTWKPLATRFSQTLNMSSEIPASISATEANYVDALEQTRVEYASFNSSLQAYYLNGEEILKALDEIPRNSQGRRSSDIARDPRFAALNVRITSLFRTSQELENAWTAAGGRLILATTQVEQSLAELKHEAVSTVLAVPDQTRQDELMDSIMKELVASQRTIDAHPFPQVGHPAVVLQDLDSVSVATLRGYIAETQGHLRDVLSPAFSAKIEERFEAEESIALPLQRILILSARSVSSF